MLITLYILNKLYLHTKKGAMNLRTKEIPLCGDLNVVGSEEKLCTIISKKYIKKEYLLFLRM